MRSWQAHLSWSETTLVLACLVLVVGCLIALAIQMFKNWLKRYRRHRLWQDLRRHRDG